MTICIVVGHFQSLYIETQKEHYKSVDVRGVPHSMVDFGMQILIIYGPCPWETQKLTEELPKMWFQYIVPYALMDTHRILWKHGRKASNSAWRTKFKKKKKKKGFPEFCFE